jgi:hypothetical protein
MAMEAAGSCGTPVNFYNPTGSYNPEDSQPAIFILAAVKTSYLTIIKLKFVSLQT